MLPSLSLEGKVAIVTGGRRGIGRAIALAFAEAGADVAVCDLVVEGGEMAAVTEEIRKLGRRSLGVQTDVTRKADVDDLVKRVIDEFGVIDILVNNAGIAVRLPLLETPEDEWNNVIDTNLNGGYLCAHAVGKGMVERRSGNIINIASMQGIRAASGQNAGYNTSKAGVIMLTRGLAWELGQYNIRVNAIAPGGTRTEMLRPLWSDSEALKQSETRIPLGRIGEPTDIANAALFLASEASSYITGHTLVVDGGTTA